MRRVTQFGQLGCVGQIGEEHRLAFFPNAADQTFFRLDRMGAEKTVERDRVGGGLLQNPIGHIDQRRAAFGKERRHQRHPLRSTR
jgi:hypothetical protein